MTVHPQTGQCRCSCGQSFSAANAISLADIHCPTDTPLPSSYIPFDPETMVARDGMAFYRESGNFPEKQEGLGLSEPYKQLVFSALDVLDRVRPYECPLCLSDVLPEQYDLVHDCCNECAALNFSGKDEGVGSEFRDLLESL